MDPFFIEFSRRVSKCICPIVGFADQLRWDDTSRIYQEYGSIALGGQTFGPTSSWFEGEMFGDKETRLLSQFVEHRAPRCDPVEVKTEGDRKGSILSLKIASPFKHKEVMAIRSIGIRLGDSLIDDQGHAQFVGLPASDIEGRIFVGSKSVVGPIENIRTGGKFRSSVKPQATFAQVKG